MRWFCGVIGGKEFTKETVIKAYEKYYGTVFVGECSEQNNYFNYVVLESDSTSEYILHKDGVTIAGDFGRIHLQERYQYEKKALVELYIDEGLNFLQKLSGTFSFVIYDSRINKVYLVRDQFGLCQLFYYKEESKIYFANSLYLLKGKYASNRISQSYLNKYVLNNGLLDFKETPYRDIYRVEAASYVEICEGKEKFNEYWTIFNKVENGLENWDYEKWKECIERKLNYSIQKNISSKRSALLLSGGLDSNVLLYYIIHNGKNIESYSAVFDKIKSSDERLYIDCTKEKYREQKFEYVVSDNAGIFEKYPESYFYTSEPHVNILNKALSENIFEAIKNNNIKIAVDGFFADHIFSGSPLYLIDLIRRFKFNCVNHGLSQYAQSVNKSIWDVLREELYPAFSKKNIYGILNSVMQENVRYMQKIHCYNNMDMIIQIRSSLARNFGDFELAPRYGIKCIHPYVDVELVNLLYAIPGEYKSSRGKLKVILRDIAKGKVPQKIIDRVVKTNHVELSQNGLRKNWMMVFSNLKKGRICELNFCDFTVKEWVQKLQYFRCGKIVDDNIWVLLSLEVWLCEIEKKYGKLIYEE